MLKKYLKNIFEVSKRGDATESSYYSCIDELFKNYAESINKKQVHVTTIPQKTDAGNPDFRVWDGKRISLGILKLKLQALSTWIKLKTQTS